MFTKTDLAKFLNVWRDKPDVVSKGAQKNFADFASFVGGEWNRHPNDFNEMYYREAIAKAIVFRSVERLVTEQPWYRGGYRANVVAYAISKLAYDVAQRGGSINFERVWRAQGISPGLRDALVVSARAVHDVIVDPPGWHAECDRVGKAAVLLASGDGSSRVMARCPRHRTGQFIRAGRGEEGCRQGPTDVERHRGSDGRGPSRVRSLE